MLDQIKKELHEGPSIAVINDYLEERINFYFRQVQLRNIYKFLICVVIKFCHLSLEIL
jgi:hypothetical protein